MRRVKKEKGKKNNKKVIIIISIIIVICIVSFFIFRKVKNKNVNDENKIAVQSVAVLTGANNTSQNRFSGMVISQKTVKLQKEENRNIKKVYVEVGQAVKTGDKLFEYDTEETKTKIEQENLEVEKMQNAISNSRKQIDTINAEKNANPGGDHSSYNIEIQTLENEIKQTEYNIKSKLVEINKLKKSLKNVTITSEIDGIVQSIKDAENDENSNMMGMNGNTTEQDDSYMSIMQTGSYRVKGTINEQNMFDLNAGDRVVIHSRLDENITWKGTIENIDTSNPESNSNNYGMMMNDDPMNKSSRYPFYVNLDTMDGLMMGQHVFIEKDIGQEKTKEGMWLPKVYLVEENGEFYAWLANKNDKLEKRKIKVGEKDETLGEYQILEGISNEDYIAIPTDELKEGALVNKFENMMFPSDGMINQEVPLESGEISEVSEVSVQEENIEMKTEDVVPDKK